jgi:hypothetical protein
MNIIADKMKKKPKYTTLSDIVQNLIEKYHTVGNGSKSNRKIQHCRKWFNSSRNIVERDKYMTDHLNHSIQIHD